MRLSHNPFNARTKLPIAPTSVRNEVPINIINQILKFSMFSLLSISPLMIYEICRQTVQNCQCVLNSQHVYEFLPTPNLTELDVFPVELFSTALVSMLTSPKIISHV